MLLPVRLASPPDREGQVRPAGDGQVHILRNEGAVAAETIAVQFLPQGAVRRIDVPGPGNCSF